jgi:hypothetical protein
MLQSSTIIDNVYLGYRGGSGGNILLHLLLCSGRYHVSFDNNAEFESVKIKQWNISSPNSWKSTETWPNNLATALKQTDLQKIFFYCNPTVDDFFRVGQDFSNIKQIYNDIKDESWPNISSYQEYCQLPNWIQNECENFHGMTSLITFYKKHKKFVWVYTDLYSQNELCWYKKAYYYRQTDPTKKSIDRFSQPNYKNEYVDPEALPFLFRCDITLRLQDVINQPEILVDQGLIGSINEKQRELISHWISLHPKDLLENIGISVN